MKKTLCLIALILLIASALSAAESTVDPSYSGGIEGAQSFGQAEIDIQTYLTENYSEIPAGTYSANLILKCTTGN